jgi:acyl-CoA reductase-like NAD-dependent aldehyde dehydrogenase
MPPDIPGKESRVYRQPVGVVAVISPWNFPLQLSNRSVAPALACGNAVVLKPASDRLVVDLAVYDEFVSAFTECVRDLRAATTPTRRPTSGP